MGHRSCGLHSHLSANISLEVVLKALEVELQHRWEAVKQQALLGILHAASTRAAHAQHEVRVHEVLEPHRKQVIKVQKTEVYWLF